MPNKEGRRAGQNRQTPGKSRVKSKLACFPPTAKRYLERLALVCTTAAQTKNETVAALGLALISRAPTELSRILGGPRAS
jgi:hypothetical protein